MKRRSARRAVATALLLSSLTLLIASPADAAGGTVDPSYGISGKVTVNTIGRSEVNKLVVDSSGRAVGVGFQETTSGNNDAIVYRLTAKGTIDTSFGGVRRLDLGLSDFATSVVIQPDGKIVVVGSTSNGYNGFVWRLNSDGTTDKTFGGNNDGVRILDSAAYEYVNDVALAPDGKIVAVGSTSAGTGVMAIYRLTTAGLPDNTFDTDGAYGISTNSAEAYAVRVQGDRKIVLAGYEPSYGNTQVYRLTEGGPLDDTWGDHGRAQTTAEGHDVLDLVAAPNGGTYVLTATKAYGDWDPVVLRLTSTGTVDPTFGGVSGARIDLGADEWMEGLAVLRDGSVVVAGNTYVGYDLLVVQLTPQGKRDTRLGPNGVLTRGGAPSYAETVAVQKDGKILVAGSDDRTVARAVILRLLGTSTPVYCNGKLATIIGTGSSDRIVGTSRADVIVGLAGNDSISGGAGNDTICGGSGNDTISGGDGADTLLGGSGTDKLYGGAGTDKVVQ